MLVKDLKEKLKSYGLSTEGLKKDLEARLENHENELNLNDPTRIITQKQQQSTSFEIENNEDNQTELNESSSHPLQLDSTEQIRNVTEEANNSAMTSNVDETTVPIPITTDSTIPSEPTQTEEQKQLETEQKLAKEAQEAAEKEAAENLEKEKIETERLEKIRLFVQEQSDLYKQIFTQTKELLNINVCKKLEECLNINKLTLEDLNNEKLMEILQSTNEKCVEVFDAFLAIQPEPEPEPELEIVTETETNITDTPPHEVVEFPLVVGVVQQEVKIEKPSLTNVDQLIQMLTIWKKSNDNFNAHKRNRQNQLKKAARPGPNEEKLAEILARTGYSHEVSSGQRKYGGPPPNWPEPVTVIDYIGDITKPLDAPDTLISIVVQNGHKDEAMIESVTVAHPAAVPPMVHPGVGCECFVGKLPRDLFEDELIPVFEKEGKIWDLRLMIDPSTGFSKGYCFVTYCDKEAAALAAKKLNDTEIRSGKPIRVNVSVANVRLFIGNIPKTKSKEELKTEFGKLVEGLCELIIFNGGEIQTQNSDEKIKNRGFCFLEFIDHKSASVAKRKLSKFNRVLNREIAVDWADPHEEPDEETMAKVKVLYVKNLAGEVTEDEVKTLFEQYGKLERVRKMKDYAFIHFEEREACLKAMEEQNNKLLGNNMLEVSLARPLTDKKKQSQGKNDHHQQQVYGNGNRGGGVNGNRNNNNYSNGGNNNNMNWNNNLNNYQMSNGRGGFNGNRGGNRGGFNGGGNRGGANNNNNNNNQRFNNNSFNGNNMNRGGGFGQNNNNNNFNRGGNANWNGNGAGGNRSFGGNNNSFNNGNNNNNTKVNNNKRKNGGSMGGAGGPGNNMGDNKKFRFNQNNGNGNNMDLSNNNNNNWNNGAPQQQQQISFDNQQMNGGTGEQGNNNVWYQDNFNSSSQWL